MATSRTDCGPADAGSGSHTVTSFVPSGIPLIVAVYVARNVFTLPANAAVATRRASAAMNAFFMRDIVTLMPGRALPGRRTFVRVTVFHGERGAADRDDHINGAGG